MLGVSLESCVKTPVHRPRLPEHLREHVVRDDLDGLISLGVAGVDRIDPDTEGLLAVRVRTQASLNLVSQPHREVLATREIPVALVPVEIHVREPDHQAVEEHVTRPEELLDERLVEGEVVGADLVPLDLVLVAVLCAQPLD
jgi:hypothetical protein